MSSESKGWIFVSHASADLAQVRKVRNYLEDQGASPLLFHLRALQKPEDFWPLIEREISDRNFFLYCDSEAARASQWVRRERNVVEELRRTKPIRIASISVGNSEAEIDTAALDAFLSKTRVYISTRGADDARLDPFVAALRARGFVVTDTRQRSSAFASLLNAFVGINQTALERGWFLAFLSRAGIAASAEGQRTLMMTEIETAVRDNARILPVFLDPVPLPDSLRGVAPFEAFKDPDSAPDRLAAELLVRD